MGKRLLFTLLALLTLFTLTQCAPQTPNTAPEAQTSGESSTAPGWEEGTDRITRTKEFETLMAPIDEEIRTYARSFSSPEQMIQADTEKLATSLLKKYHNNLDAIVQALEKERGQHLSQKEREFLMRMIVEDEIARIFSEELEEMLGTPSIEIEATVVPVSPPANQP